MNVPLPVLYVQKDSVLPSFSAELRWDVEGVEFGVQQEVATTDSFLDASAEVMAVQLVIDHFVKWVNENQPAPNYGAAYDVVGHLEYPSWKDVEMAVDAALQEDTE